MRSVISDIHKELERNSAGISDSHKTLNKIQEIIEGYLTCGKCGSHFHPLDNFCSKCGRMLVEDITD